MKIFFYMNKNSENLSGVSWKLWKIERKQCKVTVWWGPAILQNRKPRPANTLQSKFWIYASEEEAVEEEQKRIREKVGKGYTRTPKTKKKSS